MLIAERKHQAIVGGGGLQLEIESPTEAFAKREAPGARDARAERGMQNKLHTARFVKEAFDDNGGGRRKHVAQLPGCFIYICDGLAGAGFVQVFARGCWILQDRFAKSGDRGR